MTSASTPTETIAGADHPARYVVIGAGAVGASIAAELHRSGVETLLVARGAQLAALREHGLTYVRPDGSHRLRIPVAAGPDEVELTEHDVLLLATKSQDTAGAAAEWAWRPVKRTDGGTGVAAAELPLVTLQNGLANERTALRWFDRVIGGVVWIPATYVVPGEIVNHGHPVPAVLFLGEYPNGTGAVTERIATGLRKGGFTVHPVPDITAHKAAKLLGNLVNTLDALYPPSALRDAALETLRAEARAVYAAAGIVPATPDQSGFTVAEIATHPRAGNSTRQSLTRAALPETDYLDGEIVLLGRLHGVPTPAAAAIQARVHRAIAEATRAGSLDDADLAATLPAPSEAAGGDPPVVLVGADEVYRRAAQANPPVLLDVRWAPGDPDGERRYRDGHLPGAVQVDLDTDLGGRHETGAGPRPLPSPRRLQAAARRWGIRRDTTVVVYDDNGGPAAARAWWLLRWAGVPDVRVLDGGLAAWRDAGFAEAAGSARPRAAGDIELDGGHLPVPAADGMATRGGRESVQATAHR
ncbi:2-dehydropantoate 2-reductase N-terminal domain-containing protein [Actinoplanes regularis]|nr:2-dehydropantoate 2-reductase N-terminal domain-containing protein [Actinoplanes regularis]